jgi:hypothetical protein
MDKSYIRFDMQTIIILFALVLSVFYLGRRIWNQFYKKNSSCEGCALNQTPTKEQQHHGEHSAL